MADLIIKIDDKHLNRIHDSFAKAYGWQPAIADPKNPQALVLNPESKADHFKRIVETFIRDSVRQAECDIATDAARRAASKKVDDDKVI